MEAEAARVTAALDTEPDILRTLRAVDICGVEGEQPLWVSAETLRRVRDRSRAAAAKRPSHGLDPLRLTVHAGEDFKWLTSGIRAVAEPFQWKLIERGDRIGHGIAVTMDPCQWWERHKGCSYPVKAIDRLLDLAFLAQYTADRGRSAEQDEWLIDEVAVAVKALGFRAKNKDDSPADLVKTATGMWNAIGRAPARRLLGTRRQPAVGDPLHEQWLHSYFWRKSTQKRAETQVFMKVDHGSERAPRNHHWHERDLLVMAWERLISEIARWQVSIESNPSSNLVVGGLDSMVAQDFLASRPTLVMGRGKGPLTWTISTDDPITFSTTLADEYAYAWAGMVLREEKPYDPTYARALLDEAAETSMRMRFTVPRRAGRSERVR